MVSNALLQRLNHCLNDPQRTKVFGNVSRESFIAFQQGLLDMPETALETLLNSETCFAIGDGASLCQALLDGGASQKDAERYSKCYGFQSPYNCSLSRALGGKAFLVSRADTNLLEIRHTTRHEAGHALDHINAGYSGYKSLSRDYKAAFNQYMMAKEGIGRTELAYHGDRGFRHDHAPLYDQSALELELTAEMFDKYCHRQSTYGPADAEAYMARNYPHVWAEMKESIIPQIITSLERQGLDKEANIISGHSAETNAQSENAAWLTYIIGHEWQTAQTVTGNQVSRIPVNDLSDGQREKIVEVLRSIDIQAVEHESGSLGATIRVSQTHEINRLTALNYLTNNAEWLVDEAQSGESIARIATKGWSQEWVDMAVDGLQKLGLRPTTPVSSTLGSTIRITGTEQIQQLASVTAQLSHLFDQKTEIPISRLDWSSIEKGSVSGLEVNVKEWEQEDIDQLIRQLSSLGIDDVSVRSSSLQNKDFVVRVMGEHNVKTLEQLFIDESVGAVANQALSNMHVQFDSVNIEQPHGQCSSKQQPQPKAELELEH